MATAAAASLDMWKLIGLVIVGYLPGALIFRLPGAGRTRRAALSAEERLFWAIVISIAVSSTVAFLLAVLGRYAFGRLLVIDATLSLLILARWRGQLHFPAPVRPAGWTAFLPAALVVLGLWLYFPPAEYVIGGRDPGVYLHQGVQIAQQGSLVIHDPTVAAVPASARDLFFPRQDPTYNGLRFPGFFVFDPEAGTVVSQFPHLYPTWIAIGYDLNGLMGARQVVGVCALLGLLAVYFAGAQLLGRPAAFAGAALLALNVIEVWFGRYPNSELGQQALLFAALLALARAEEDSGGRLASGDGGRDGTFFAVVAAALLGLALFVRIGSVLAVGAVIGALALRMVDGRRPTRPFVVALAIAGSLAAVYYGTLVRPYAQHQIIRFITRVPSWQIGVITLAAAAGLALVLFGRRPEVARVMRARMPLLLSAGMVSAAVYAYFLRTPGGTVEPYDAMALRTFAAYYLTPYGLAAAVLGYVLVVRRWLWKNPALVLVITAFTFLYFYRIWIVPEHFWMARRFLAVVLPGALLMVGAVALWPLTSEVRGGEPRGLRLSARTWTRLVVGVAFLSLLGWQFWQASRPVLRHIEYAGITGQLERLVERFGEQDLVIVESIGASDLHALALPLAYLYGRSVLVLDSQQPDQKALGEFLTWARARYHNIYFLAGGGSRIVSPSIAVEAIANERFHVPEYEPSHDHYPRGARNKTFDFGIYRFASGTARADWFVLDVGAGDDLHTKDFHGKELHEQTGITYRWTRDASSIWVVPPSGSSLVTLWLSDGARPKALPRAQITVSVNGRVLGTATVATTLTAYTFAIPPDLAAELGSSSAAAQLKILSNTWVPHDVLGTPDVRGLGVVVDRVEVR